MIQTVTCVGAGFVGKVNNGISFIFLLVNTLSGPHPDTSYFYQGAHLEL